MSIKPPYAHEPREAKNHRLEEGEVWKLESFSRAAQGFIAGKMATGSSRRNA